MTNRTQPLSTLELLAAASTIEGNGDYGDMLGALRLVELAADAARHAVIADAREAGQTWQTIADALGTSRQAAHERYAR